MMQCSGLRRLGFIFGECCCASWFLRICAGGNHRQNYTLIAYLIAEHDHEIVTLTKHQLQIVNGVAAAAAAAVRVVCRAGAGRAAHVAYFVSFLRGRLRRECTAGCCAGRAQKVNRRRRAQVCCVCLFIRHEARTRHKGKGRNTIRHTADKAESRVGSGGRRVR